MCHSFSRQCLYIAFIIVSLFKTEYRHHHLIFFIGIKAALVNDDGSVLRVHSPKFKCQVLCSCTEPSGLCIVSLFWMSASFPPLSPKPLAPSHPLSEVKSQIHIYHLPSTHSQHLQPQTLPSCLLL